MTSPARTIMAKRLVPGGDRGMRPVGHLTRALAAGLLLCLFLWGVHGIVHAAEKTGFWIGVRATMLVDQQVADEIGARAGMVALRAGHENQARGYTFPEVVSRFKRAAPGVPVLAYAQVSRHQAGGRIESYLLRDLKLDPVLAETAKGGRKQRFLDITNPNVRRAVVERLAEERTLLGVDGFAVDLAARRPVARPQPLARICAEKPQFCEAYARSMDEIFGALNAALGDRGTVLYNGLWSAVPGLLEDQSKLLLHADAAAIEYFGLDPRGNQYGFKEAILPYLEAIPRLPKGKPVLFFGRGPWGYTDYAADYRWQRYLYGSFLLARRPEDMFKYHSSFQAPAHAGRAGGLDVYADRHTDLGAAQGPYRVESGLYQREFSRGRVVVAPDDGQGGRVRLATTFYTTEGDALSGEVAVAPGEALILLNSPHKSHGKQAHRIDAKKIASWGWAHAELVKTSDGERLRLNALPAGLEGEHDLLLDFERSRAPFERVEIDATLLDPASAILAVAEVDDQKSTHMWVVVAIGSAGNGVMRIRDAVPFRSHFPKETSPGIAFQHKPGVRQRVVLDGPKALGGTQYRFRRWSHVRLVGPLEISSVVLDRRPAVPITLAVPLPEPQAVRPERKGGIQSKKSR